MENHFDLCCNFSTLLTGIRQTQSQSIKGSCKQPNMKMTSTALWTTRVHVNVANVTFPNVSGSARLGPTCQPGRLSLGAYIPIHLSPSDCLCIYIESVQFARCVCEVRVIQTLQQVYCLDKRHHFTEKRGK